MNTSTLVYQITDADIRAHATKCAALRKCKNELAKAQKAHDEFQSFIRTPERISEVKANEEKRRRRAICTCGLSLYDKDQIEISRLRSELSYLKSNVKALELVSVPESLKSALKALLNEGVQA